MRPRQMHQLAGMNRPSFLRCAAEGLGHIGEHVESLEGAARAAVVGQSRRGGEVLRAVAEEEAGKFLILLDAIRVSWRDQATRASQLRRCHDHLAKGLYAAAVEIRPADLSELTSYLNGLRVSHYLDGPNDVDWVFRNEIEAQREERLYVDYVAMDDGAAWLTPARFDVAPSYPESTPGAVALVQALVAVGVSTPDGVETVASTWQDYAPGPSTHYQDLRSRIDGFLEALGARTGIQGTAALYGRIRDTWPFPLYNADLSMVSVDLADLRSRQDQWLADQL